jgi:diacylglycerol kinase family enzyme
MKLLVLVNPSSGGGRALKKWTGYSRLLSNVDRVILKNIEEATALAAQASGYDAVVACGGDGTVNAVVNGLMRNADARIKLGVLYAGTSPDFCRFYRIPLKPGAAVELLISGRSKEVEVLEARHNGRTAYFCCSCNLGMGAEVAELANRMRPVLGNGAGTFCALLRSLARGRRYTYRVNGEAVENCNHLLITKMPYIAGGLRLDLPPLAADEYALWTVQGVTRFGWLKLLPKLYRGGKVGNVRVCSGVTWISSPETVKLEYDGDPHGVLPVEISVSARKLPLICGG